MRYVVRPWRLAANGRPVTADETSDQLVESRLYAAITTRAADGDHPGEHLLAPGFGIPDPVGQGVDTDALRATISEFGPSGVHITAVDVAFPNDHTQNATVRWERDNDGST